MDTLLPTDSVNSVQTLKMNVGMAAFSYPALHELLQAGVASDVAGKSARCWRELRCIAHSWMLLFDLSRIAHG
jgi:hypothetical protein